MRGAECTRCPVRTDETARRFHDRFHEYSETALSQGLPWTIGKLRDAEQCDQALAHALSTLPEEVKEVQQVQRQSIHVVVANVGSA
jgi:hypothetical protein